MSSLSAAQADGYYIPPAFLESGKFKKQSRGGSLAGALNQFAGSKGHNQYLQRSVVRFELPYDGFCLGCQACVGRGTRFNAHKAHVDDYHSTKIWEFTTKCRACASVTFKIRTNPRERGFDYTSGIKKKIEEFDTVAAGTAGVIDTDLGNGIIEENGTVDADIRRFPADIGRASNPLAKLEKGVVGERKAMSERDQMEALLKINEGSMLEDAASNANLRSTYRSARKAKKRRLGAAAAVGLGKGIEIADPTEEDSSMARSMFRDSRSGDRRARRKEKESFSQLRSGSIFGKSSEGRVGLRLKSSDLTGTVPSRIDPEFSEPKPSKSKNENRRKKEHLLDDDGHRASSSSSEITADGSRLGGLVHVVKKREKTGTDEPASSSALDALADYGSDSD